MKALSIKQPYAQLIGEGIKPIENRSFRTHFRGRTYIHASAQWHDRLKKNSLFTKEQWESIHKHNLDKKIDLNLYRYLQKEVATDKLPVSAIIGEVDIVDCVINHPSIWAEKSLVKPNIEDYKNNEGGNLELFHHNLNLWKNSKPIYNWVLSNPVLYDKPILNVKGKLSFWEWNVCHICYNETSPEFTCRSCEQLVCENCTVPYNQFSQVDYTLCNNCE